MRTAHKLLILKQQPDGGDLGAQAAQQAEPAQPETEPRQNALQSAWRAISNLFTRKDAEKC